jgi:outer membrane murein-binding lipoprotein Lpp
MRCHRSTKRITALFAVLIGGLGISGCKPSSPEARIDHVSERIANKLDFTNQQKDLMKEITNEIKADFADEKSHKLAMKDEVQKMILAPELDRTKVRALIMARQERMNSKVDKYLEKVAALHRTLNQEQRNEIIEKMDELSERFHH